jgi:hypothetical protein
MSQRMSTAWVVGHCDQPLSQAHPYHVVTPIQFDDLERIVGEENLFLDFALRWAVVLFVIVGGDDFNVVIL